MDYILPESCSWGVWLQLCGRVHPKTRRDSGDMALGRWLLGQKRGSPKNPEIFRNFWVFSSPKHFFAQPVFRSPRPSPVRPSIAPSISEKPLERAIQTYLGRPMGSRGSAWAARLRKLAKIKIFWKIFRKFTDFWRFWPKRPFFPYFFPKIGQNFFVRAGLWLKIVGKDAQELLEWFR